MAHSTQVCTPLAVLLKDTRLTMHIVGGPLYEYPAAQDAVHETTDTGTGAITYPEPSGPLAYPYYTFQGGVMGLFVPCEPPVVGSFNPTHWCATPRSISHQDSGRSRYATRPGGPTHLTTNISIVLSQVSYPHPLWRFVVIQFIRHAGIDL